jgi:hypothetical protein
VFYAQLQLRGDLRDLAALKAAILDAPPTVVADTAAAPASPAPAALQAEA